MGPDIHIVEDICKYASVSLSEVDIIELAMSCLIPNRNTTGTLRTDLTILLQILAVFRFTGVQTSSLSTNEVIS